jgi:hypothetical protein
MPTRARKSSKAPAAPSSSTAAADTATALASQLLDDTISLAVEDNATADAATFAAFIVDMLPPEVLETLKAVAGFDVDDVEPPSPSHSTSSSSSTVNAQDLAFLSEVWAERVAPDDPLPGDDGDGGGALSPSTSYECELCDRVIQTTRHHLHPRETHAWLQTRDPAHYTDTLLGTTVNLCRMVRLFPFFLFLRGCAAIDTFFNGFAVRCGAASVPLGRAPLLPQPRPGGGVLHLGTAAEQVREIAHCFHVFSVHVSSSQRQSTCFCQMGIDVARSGQLAYEVTPY